MKHKAVIKKLDGYSETHPNCVLLWKNYIYQKKETYLKSIHDCERALQLFAIQPDMSFDMILFLYIYNLSMK